MRGETYGGVRCCAVLDGAADAYEWSFVAVPAQREAGVRKSYGEKGGTGTAEDLIKTLRRARGEVALTEAEASALAGRIERLEREASCGRAYRARLKKEFVRCAAIAQPGIPAEAVSRAADGMDLEDLECFSEQFRRSAEKTVPLSPQLAGGRKNGKTESNAEFRI